VGREQLAGHADDVAQVDEVFEQIELLIANVLLLNKSGFSRSNP
jgi:hypothetical protein